MNAAPSSSVAGSRGRRLSLYLQVLVAIGAGALVGLFAPEVGSKLKPLGDVFVKLMGVLAAPIIFTTVVLGLAGMGDLKKVGRLGFKALIYFEVVTTLALLIGMAVALWVRPGAGMNINPASLDATTAHYSSAANPESFVDFLLDLIPRTFVGAFTEGRVLQVLVLAVLFGIGLAAIGEHARPLLQLLTSVARALFAVVGVVVRFAPIAAFGAMAFTVGKYGASALWSLGAVMICVYATCAIFICVVLAVIARLAGFRFWRVLKFIRDEILIVFGTSSSEAGMPGLMAKLERAGCSRASVGLIVPSGYSFNLDGTCIYVSIAALFIAQATNTALTSGDLLTFLVIVLFTSKGAAAITGGGFITLTTTLAAMGKIPIGGLALIVGIDRFMSEARAVTNVIGIGVATLAVARWDGEFDPTQAPELLAAPPRTPPIASAVSPHLSEDRV